MPTPCPMSGHCLKRPPPSAHGPCAYEQERLPRTCAPTFWTVATMPSDGVLSPALQNRFSVCPLPLEDPAAGVAPAYAVLLPDAVRDAAVGLLQEPSAAAWVQVRHQIRFLRCIAHLLHALGPDAAPLSTRDSLKRLLHLVAADGCVDVEAQAATGAAADTDLHVYLEAVLGLPAGAPMPWPPETYTLTPERRAVAGALCLGLCSQLPVVLQGPASVGKTHFARLLAQYRTAKGGVNRLETVSNTATTTSADYLGCYLPVQGTCQFFEGPLARAMRTGALFLADELNLAAPEVLSALQPVLEGRAAVAVPGTDVVVPRHPAFRFIATQNPTQV